MTINRTRPEEKRTKRVPVSQQKNIITVPQRKGWVRRWVNDVEQRVEMFKRAGWKLVEGDVDVGDKGVINQNQSLGTGARKYMGNGISAVLMEIQECFYLEDQRAKQDEIKEHERALWRDLNSGADGTYGGVKVK